MVTILVVAILPILQHSSCSQNIFFPFVCSSNASLLPQALLATPPTPGINISGTSTSFLKRSPNPSLKNPPLIILTLSHRHRHSPAPTPTTGPTSEPKPTTAASPAEPAHDCIATPPPIQQPKPPSSRLQQIRPPPLMQITNRPPPLLTAYF
ncbi:hypothetical protein VIGAN_03269500, partial [Vigna angularis var. angularis]